MRPEIEKIIEKELKKYEVKSIKIEDKANNKVYNYNLHIFSKDEDLNLFEGFLFGEVKEKSELSHLISRYRAPVSGYAPRLSLLIYDNQLLIKDYRRNKLIRKTIKKINQPFILKLKKALSEPDENNFNKLFDRTDIIEEFYILYKKARDFLLKNIKGISGEERREEFVDNLMMQMLTLWYLQERGFFNNDTSYLITKFKELKQKKLFKGFDNYYEFLTYLFEKIGGYLDNQYYQDEIVGKVVVVGPAIFLNGEHDAKAISIPDKCFYKEGITEILITTQPKKVGDEVPLLNLFESRDWTEGNIDEFVLGAIYEKLITYMERKKLGAYYTPEEITSYICKNTIEPYLIDRVNEKFGKNFESIDQIIESENKEILSYLFVQLKEIKILDPAVGSAHFLESAINVLVSIYEKLWNKAKEMGLRKGLEILAADDCGRIKTINLLEISDEEQFKLYVKFFIILSKNIYGVDINPSALKVAKARLFLTLAKHFDIHKNYFIRFPNVHFNLREGNSLIGYVELKKEEEKKGQLGLEFSVREEEATYITEAIKPVKDKDLRKYLIETAHALGINGNIVKEIEDLNKILSKKEIKWNDFEFVLRTKEKLIRILIASLNSQYARPLNEILNQITKLFNGKLDEKFAKEYSIKLGELKKIKTFHWVFEFPEVFLDKGGFDVVVGNPPYVSYGLRGVGKLSDFEKELLQALFKSAEYKIATYTLFIERSIELSCGRGYSSLIVPDSFLLGQYFSKIRKVVLDTCEIKGILFLKFKVFVGSTVGISVVYIFRKNLNQENRLQNELQTALFESFDDFANNKGQMYRYGQSYFLTTDLHRFRLFFRKEDFEVINFIDKKVKKEYLGSICKFSSGLIGKKGKEEIISKEKIDKRWQWGIISGEEINRYQLSKPTHFILYDPNILKSGFKDAKYNEPKLLMRQTGDKLVATFDCCNFLCLNNLHIGNFITSPNLLKSILTIVNSKLMTYYYRKISLEEGRVMAQTDIETIEKLPIPMLNNEINKILSQITNYLLFLNATEERRTQLKEIIEFFDRWIADSLIYELYFKEKFHSDGLYPEPKEYLLELVSKHLKPINYDCWAELYWKKQLDGNLTSQEEKELENLEKEILKTIEEVYNSLVYDKQIQKQIEKIKSHEWVKVIEKEK
jgi:hypothetical protein